MKTPEEYLDEVHFHKNIRNTLSQILSPDGINNNMYERLLKAFDLIQKESYNQAIDDAVKSFEVKVNRNYPYEITKHDFYLDNNSILKLKIK